MIKGKTIWKKKSQKAVTTNTKDYWLNSKKQSMKRPLKHERNHWRSRRSKSWGSRCWYKKERQGSCPCLNSLVRVKLCFWVLDALTVRNYNESSIETTRCRLSTTGSKLTRRLSSSRSPLETLSCWRDTLPCLWGRRSKARSGMQFRTKGSWFWSDSCDSVYWTREWC